MAQQRRVGAVTVVDGLLVRVALRVVVVVTHAQTEVGRQQTSRLAQLDAVLDELVEVETSAVGIIAVGDDVVKVVAVLQTVGYAERIVGLETEVRTRHHRVVLGYAPVDTGIQSVVIVEVVRTSLLLERTQILERSFIPLGRLREVPCTRAVEEVAGLKFHLLVLAPRVRVVDTDRADIGNAALRTYHILSDAAAHAAAHAALRGHNRNLHRRGDRNRLRRLGDGSPARDRHHVRALQ